MATSPWIPWFDRTFHFAFPVENRAELVERIADAPLRLTARVGRTPKQKRALRLGGRWSVLEHAGHLGDLEPLWSARLDDFERGVATLRPADLQNRATEEAGHNARPEEEILAAFSELRDAFVARLRALPADVFARTARHPRLGLPMRLVDLVQFVAEHDDFHLARIAECG